MSAFTVRASKIRGTTTDFKLPYALRDSNEMQKIGRVELTSDTFERARLLFLLGARCRCHCRKIPWFIIMIRLFGLWKN